MKLTKLALITFSTAISISATCAPKIESKLNPELETIKEKKSQIIQIWSFYKVKDSEESRRDFFKTLNSYNLAQTDYCAPIPDCIFPDIGDDI